MVMPEWLQRRYKLLGSAMQADSFSALDVKEVLGDSRSMSYLVIRELRRENLMQKVSQGVYTLRRDRSPCPHPRLRGRAGEVLSTLRRGGIHVVMTGMDALEEHWPGPIHSYPMLATADKAEWRLLASLGRHSVPILLNPSRSELRVVSELGFQERPLVVRKISTYYGAIRGIARPERAVVDTYAEWSRYGWIADQAQIAKVLSSLFHQYIVNVPMLLAYARYRRMEPEMRYICQSVADELYPQFLLRGPIEQTPSARSVVETIQQIRGSK